MKKSKDVLMKPLAEHDLSVVWLQLSMYLPTLLTLPTILTVRIGNGLQLLLLGYDNVVKVHRTAVAVWLLACVVELQERSSMSLISDRDHIRRLPS